MYEIESVRAEPSEDLSHEHVALVGYLSPHTPGEPITIPIARVLQKIALGETFGIVAGDQKAEVAAGKCPVCGLEPYLKTSADSGDRSPLLDLPRK